MVRAYYSAVFVYVCYLTYIRAHCHARPFVAAGKEFVVKDSVGFLNKLSQQGVQCAVPVLGWTAASIRRLSSPA